jgi:hypothetical protein
MLHGMSAAARRHAIIPAHAGFQIYTAVRVFSTRTSLLSVAGYRRHFLGRHAAALRQAPVKPPARYHAE